ncbi:type I-E CRISPR-associated protein Cse2/CasB [Reinekea marinisedimentorum]|uniref:CRISPR system Cascade subunit CasB n=1 Tax=Reinekea marinisedimentorum TaxID=230495 RepID=A0A4R3I019_9GAMM|nr:type I-E CRISPR-associated protein Cse2/CasB [Reinekea marinisedimentorum]TCS39016.1 CRISPR system Cascade subunit CasB [Reinekea marinisedimentorum]
MYNNIYNAIQILSKGDVADLKRRSLASIADAPAYFRILAYSKSPDSKQTQRIIFLLLHTKLADGEDGLSVAQALINAGVKEGQIIQLVRSGDNGIDYLKRQLVRCKDVSQVSLGKLAQYWGENARRQLLKEFILANTEKFETESN